jgi:hypothetical protein
MPILADKYEYSYIKAKNLQGKSLGDFSLFVLVVEIVHHKGKHQKRSPTDQQKTKLDLLVCLAHSVIVEGFVFPNAVFPEHIR